MMRRRALASALILVWMAALVSWGAGCSRRHKITFQSDTRWIAEIDHQNSAIFSDSGSAVFRVAGDIHCVTARNLNDTGFLRIRIDDGAWAETTVPHGTVEACR